MLIPLEDNLYRLDTPFLGVPLSLYVITGEQTVLIDSGIVTTPEEFIFPALEAAGLTPNWLICTHGHVDQFGGNSVLRKRYPAMKIALYEEDALCAVDLYLREGLELDFGTFHFRVIHTREHSPRHVMLVDVARRLVINGDVALSWGAPASRIPNTSSYTYNPDLYSEGVKTELALDGASSVGRRAEALAVMG